MAKLLSFLFGLTMQAALVGRWSRKASSQKDETDSIANDAQEECRAEGATKAAGPRSR